MTVTQNSRREDILLAAAQIFSQKGFHAASMQDIADAVQLQKASIYYHVSSKQEILLAILDQALDLLTERVQEALQLPGTADEKLRRAMQVYLLTLLEHRDLAAVLLLEHRSLEPELRSRHIPRRDRFERLWRELIETGRKEGRFDCQDAGIAVRSLLGALNWAITWYRPDGPLSGEAIAEQLAGLFLNGLLRRDLPPV